jgi:hypothetical protein
LNNINNQLKISVKMKKYLFLAVAALGFAACAEKDLGNGPVHSGELEQSYVAITLAAGDMTTKADDGSYDKGLDAERAVNSAYVFFFKDGAAFPVSFDASTSTTTNTGGCNYLPIAHDGNGENMNNVSDVKDAVLVLQNYKGEYPNQIVAVLNWQPTETSYTLAALQAEVSALGNDAAGYVMSNAVYADNYGQTVDAVAVSLNNIAKNEADALANPVTIYVERVAAKVVFTAASNGKFAVEKEIDGQQVYALIKGFELYNDYQQSYLIKRINPSWTDLGFNWNDANWYRSYWAESLTDDFTENTFEWDTNNTPIDGYVYCGENTRAATVNADVRTKVIVKAQLVDDTDQNNPIEVVNWYGKDYVGKSSLLAVVANTLKNTYYTSTDGASFTGAVPADIETEGNSVTADKAYQVFFKLSDTGAAKTWYKYEGGKYNAISAADFNTILASVQPALIYTNGMTYYTLDIKHLGAAGKTGEYGVVRNHVYKVNITDITGYGTPVYEGTTDFVTPEKPEDVMSFVSAQINILSWRLVENDYTLGN